MEGFVGVMIFVFVWWLIAMAVKTIFCGAAKGALFAVRGRNAGWR